MAVGRPPVRDWATDFDHTDPAWAHDAFAIWDDLRTRCPVARSERYGGAWLPLRHADVAAVAYDTEHFTSRVVVVGEGRPGDDVLPAPIGEAPPITSDPPFHAAARRLLLAPFAPKAVAALEPFTQKTCDDLLDGLEPGAIVDAAAAYAEHIPVRVIARMLGYPDSDADRFRGWVRLMMEDIHDDLAERNTRFDDLDAYLDERIAERIAEPTDDLTSHLLAARIDGRPLGPEHVRGTIVLLLVAGIDTSWSAIGAALWHLAAHPAHRDWMRSHPEKLDTAVEELLRAYAPVTMARLVSRPVELGGRALSPGDWLLLPFPAANRDPEVFERAGEVVLDREVNRHAAFGLGIHRCLGSNLARMELRVALRSWLERFPAFALADPEAVTWSTGQIRGPRCLPVRLGPTERSDA